MDEIKENFYEEKTIKRGGTMKRILKMILTGILLFCTIFSIVGCGEGTGNSSSNTESLPPKPEIPLKEGEFYSLEEAYENGWLTEEDLESIAYYYNSVEDENGQITTPKYPEELSKEIEEDIKITYFKDLKKQFPNATMEDVYMDEYYGTYGRCVVVWVLDKCRLWDLYFEDKYIGDVFFKGYCPILRAWVASE